MKRTLSAVAVVSALAATLVVTAASGGSLPGRSLLPAGGGTVGQGGSGWNADARHLRGRNGQRFSYGCPAGGGARTVWGSDLYTDDSSVCTAAVHAGRITLASGGTVTIEIRPGQSSYSASTRNGITTRSYGSWPGSFVIV